MNSHGKAGECGSLAVYRHHAAGVCGAGDGVFCVGGDGAGTVWVAVRVFVEAVDLGVGWPGGDGGGDASGLPALQASCAGVFAAGDNGAAADLRFFSGSYAQHASLDTRGWIFISAFRVGEAGDDPVSRIVSGKPREDNG